MPQDACHTNSSTHLQQLNNRIVLAHIADSKGHDADDSNIVQGFTLDRLTIFGNQRLSSQRGKFRHAAMLDKNLTSLPWFQGNIQHNVTARPFEEQRIIL